MEVSLSERPLAFFSAYCETFMYERRKDALRNAGNKRGISTATTADTSSALLVLV